MPFVLFNTSLFEENNSVYDPNMINTNLLDVNFQNKFNFSTEQYFEGKMFDQNYSDYETNPENKIQKSTQQQSNKKEAESFINTENNKENIKQNEEEAVENGNGKNRIEDENPNNESNKNHQAEHNQQDSGFRIPENINRNKDCGEKKRRSKFDQ